ncbi:MAG TPA: adenosylcobinamide-GDP ribazoletransferase [Anaeromyxobacter sp.]
MRRLAVAIAFLTRLPVPGPPPADAAEVGRAVLFFPAAGALLGGVLAAAARALSPRLPPTLCAALLVALLALLTGALHLDGLADMADGFGGGRTRDDVLRIMRDHAVGAYGAAALVLTLLVKVTAVAALLAGEHAARWLLVAPALGRWTPVALARLLPYARPGGGLGATVTEYTRAGDLAGATALALAVALAAAGAAGAVAFLGVAVFTVVHGAACRRRIGGVTGDTFGASVELAEALVLVVAVAMGA